MSGLPEGWVKADLGAVATVTSGIGFPNEHQGQISGDLPFVKVGDVSAAVLEHGGRLNTANHYVSREVAALLKGQPVRPGATVFAKIGEAIRLNRRAYVVNECLIDNNVMAVTATDERSDRYVHYFLRTVQFADVLRATTVPSLRKGDVESLAIPLAPLPEQKRIADKLDSVLARVDACRDRLDRIPALLKRFRQSVLNAATSGELSADWRASEALHGWAPVMIKEICVSISDGDHQAPPQVDQGISFITISAFSSGRLDLNKATRCVPQSYFEQLKPMRRPSLGDVLYSVTGSIGISALVDTDRPFAFQRHVALLKPDLSRVSSAYLRYLLGSDGVRRQAADVATGSAQLTIPLNGLRAFNALLPCLAEQHEIVRRVETLFAFADRLEARCAAARKQAGQLTPALLAKAFRGELVPQDPADEPAAELLKRLAASRADAPKARRGKARASTGV